MIKTRDRLFSNLMAQLHKDLPLEPMSRVVNLAAIALGMLRSKRVQVGQIVTLLLRSILDLTNAVLFGQPEKRFDGIGLTRGHRR